MRDDFDPHRVAGDLNHRSESALIDIAYFWSAEAVESALRATPPRKQVAYELRERSIENFVPTFRRRRGKRTVELPLFPGYVFCKLAVRDRSVAAFISSVIFVGMLATATSARMLKT
jgi:transcription antitermination factor NusG